MYKEKIVKRHKFFWPSKSSTLHYFAKQLHKVDFPNNLFSENKIHFLKVNMHFPINPPIWANGK